MSIDKLQDICITDDDIAWVESIMGHGIQFDEPRRNVIKNLESVDVQAFPGSGKTTTLVAKLAILAKKWPYSNAGICVLSHTNVAREEIEKRLGNTNEGKKLLSYPHFIGTLHSFFDTFIVLPWLRSEGINVKIIDTDYVRYIRWKRLSENTRAYFARFHKDEKICSYYQTWEKIDWDKQGKTRDEVLNVISRSQKNGYFTFDEMLYLAQKVLKDNPAISESIQERFPILFIDEAQDTNSLLWDLIYRAFPNDGIRTIRQGFGDSNQAIYSNIHVTETGSHFPRITPLVLSESRRFDDRIACMANSVAVSKDQMHGTSNYFSARAPKHTIFLFHKDSASCVIDEFARLILTTFTDEEIACNASKGCHVVGMVHNKTEDTPAHQFPKGIYDYWLSYDSKKASKAVMQNYFIDYFRIGKSEFEHTGDFSSMVSWLSKGLGRVINKAANKHAVAFSSNMLASILKLLPSEKHHSFRKAMQDLLLSEIHDETEWDTVKEKIKKMLEFFNLSFNANVRSFLKWTPIADSNSKDDIPISKENLYYYRDAETGRTVSLEFGSIHSVKGRTHLATLVLETFSGAHNIKSILGYLCGKSPHKFTPTNSKRLKCQYVAMTRATALLCMAIPIEFVDVECQKLLIKNGWEIEVIQ